MQRNLIATEFQVYDRLQAVGVCLSYDRTVDVMNMVGGHFNCQIIDIVKNKSRFRLVGDNINWSVGVHDQRLYHRSRMFHAFGSAVLVQNVSFDYLSDVAPQIHYSVAPVQLFIPSVEEINAIKEEDVTIVTKVAARHISLFQLFKDRVPKHSSRPVSESWKRRSKLSPCQCCSRMNNIWAAPSEFVTYRLCEQRRFRRACASAQSRQNLRCSLIQAVS